MTLPPEITRTLALLDPRARLCPADRRIELDRLRVLISDELARPVGIERVVDCTAPVADRSWRVGGAVR